MAKQTYQIAIGTKDGPFMHEVQGRKVKMPGYEDFEFFVHRRYKADLHIQKRYSGWTVSEASTGREVASEYFQKDAITKARQRMRRVTREQFLEKLEKARQFMVDNQRGEAVS